MVDGALKLVVPGASQVGDPMGERGAAILEKIRHLRRKSVIKQRIPAQEAVVEQAGIQLDIVIVQDQTIFNRPDRLADAQFALVCPHGASDRSPDPSRREDESSMKDAIILHATRFDT